MGFHPISDLLPRAHLFLILVDEDTFGRKFDSLADIPKNKIISKNNFFCN